MSIKNEQRLIKIIKIMLNTKNFLFNSKCFIVVFHSILSYKWKKVIIESITSYGILKI